MKDENGVPFYPRTSLRSVVDESGKSILDYLNGDGIFYTAETVEDGLFFVDEDLNIGANIDDYGIHSPSILPYQLVND